MAALQATVDAKLDAIYDALAATAWTPAERTAYCADVGAHPLFADGAPGAAGGAGATEDAAAAAAAVVNVEYDELDTPLALSAEAREQGNAALARGAAFFSHAARHYADALRHAAAAARVAARDGAAPDAAAAARAATSAAHANVAALALKRGHWITALDASRDALRAGGGPKPAWRAATACVRLGRAGAAADFCALGTSLGGAEAAFAPLAAEAAELARVQAAHAAGAARGAAAREASLAAVRAACAERRIAVGPPLFAGLRRTAAEPYVAPDGEVRWPLAVLYPETGQSDWLEDVGEADAVGDIVDALLAEPPEWAPRGAYAPRAVDVFFKSRPCAARPLAAAWTPAALDEPPAPDARGSEWVRVPRAAPLLLVLAQPAYVVADVPLLYVVPRGGGFWEAMRRDSGGAFAELAVPRAIDSGA